MIYCDLDINQSNIWAGVLCLTGVAINGGPAQPFVGDLFFTDTQGNDDPEYTGLGTRWLLIYQAEDGTQQTIPTLAQPNQQLTAALGEQNCFITLSTRTATLTT